MASMMLRFGAAGGAAFGVAGAIFPPAGAGVGVAEAGAFSDAGGTDSNGFCGCCCC